MPGLTVRRETGGVLILIGLLAPGGLSLLLIAPSWAAFPGANGRIGYSIYEARGSETEYFTMATVRPDGNRARVLTMGSGVEGLAFSPTGNRIAFSRSPTLYETAIFTAGPLGRARRRVTGPGVSPAWSPTGREVVFTRGEPLESAEVWIHEPSGERLLTKGREPSWSISGQIAVQAGKAIRVIRADGTNLRQVAPRGFQPDWSPDGKRLVFSVGGDIAVMRVDGSNVRRVTTGRAVDSDPAFSPDGRRIVFVRNGRTLVTTTTRGRDPRRVARALREFGVESALSDPDWQPRPTS